MVTGWTDILAHITPFVLVLSRVGGLFLAAPVLASTGVPAQVKVLVLAAMTLAVYPSLDTAHLVGTPVDLYALAPMMAGEVLVGGSIGMVILVPFASAQLAGKVMGQQMGLALADLVDPASDISGNELGQFLYFAALVTFVTMGGVERVVGSTISTFDSIPVGSATLMDAPLSLLIGVLSSSMDVALRVSMPVVTIIFLETVAVGFIMKTVPTLNIMSFGFPLRIVMGLFVFVVSFGALHAVLTSELGVVLMAIEEWAASPWR